MSDAAVTIEGTVDSVVFHNEENGYTVLRLDMAAGEETTVVGCIPGVAAGETIAATGRWTSHAVYGGQFKADVVRRCLPADARGILLFLSSGAIKGVGAATARRLVDEFGADTLTVIEDTPEKLTELKGMTRKRALDISAALRLQTGMRRLLDFLAVHNLPAQLAAPLYRRYGGLALETVKANPYLLVEEELGVPFRAADTIALALGVEGDDPLRLEAGLLFELLHNAGNGHTFLPAGKLLDATALLLSTEPSALETALDTLCRAGRTLREVIAGEDAVYLRSLHDAEWYTAERLIEMAEGSCLPPKQLDKLIERIEREQGITYAPQQREAVELAATAQVMILTGGPGTGKTTTLRGVLALFDTLGLNTVLAAPTGRAAKRLGETCGCDASTIHRLLETRYDSQTGGLTFARSQSDPLRADAVIVDETSMVDIQLMQALLGALRGDCRLVLVGDSDQLPSVGPGCVLSDLLRSGQLPAMRLTEIFRQAQESAIIMNAHSVNHGLLPELKGGGDFFFLRRTRGQEVVDTIADLCLRRLPERMGIEPHQIQVLSPTRRYATGTRSLNAALQAALNPPGEGKDEQPFGDMVFRTGDRVMQVRNNYDVMWADPSTREAGLGVFNGDIGRILSVQRGGPVVVEFEGRQVTYGTDTLGELELAYAVTVHKAQGSEYRAVILSALNGAPQLLARNVLYTAITRARELFIIVGDDQVIVKMVQNDRQQRRYSGLRARIEARA